MNLPLRGPDRPTQITTGTPQEGSAGPTSGTIGESTNASAPVGQAPNHPEPQQGSIEPGSIEPGMVAVIGDYGRITAEQYEVAAAIRAFTRLVTLDALVTTGDNLYSDDVEQAWTLPYGWLDQAGIPVLAAWGNHDIETPERTRIVASLFGDERYSTTTWYDLTFVFLDANRPDDAEQLEWMEATFAELSGETVVAVFHQTAVSCSKHGSLPELAGWLPIFERFDVDLVLQGHDHNYQHHVRNGIDYVVTGGGGAPLYPVSDCPDGSQPAAAAEEHHFLTLKQEPDGSISVEALRPDFSVIDSFRVVP